MNKTTKPETGRVLAKKEPVSLNLASPTQEIKAGTEAATALMNIVNKNRWAIKIQGKKYLVFEAWQTLGRFYGLTVKTGKTKFVEYGEAKGFEATAEVLNKAGQVVGGSEAVCLSDEPNWKGKPLYALKSMAQTRAGAKAMRQLLSWVAVLAGYEPTPKEEVPDEGFKKSFSRPAKTPGQVKPASIAQIDLIKRMISEKTVKPSVLREDLTVPQASKIISDAMKVRRT